MNSILIRTVVRAG